MSSLAPPFLGGHLLSSRNNIPANSPSQVAHNRRFHVQLRLHENLFAVSIAHLSIVVVNPCAILTSSAWFTVQAVLWVTASINPAADGWPLPLFLTPPKGRWTSAP